MDSLSKWNFYKKKWESLLNGGDYSKTCVKRPHSKGKKICFQDKLSLNAGQKYCRMLQGEHSAILLTFIKLPFVIKTFVLSIFEWLFYTGFTVLAGVISLSLLYFPITIFDCKWAMCKTFSKSRTFFWKWCRFRSVMKPTDQDPLCFQPHNNSILTNFLLVDYPIHFYTISILANSAGSDEMPPYAAFHLGLHCLPKLRYPE